MYGYYYPLIKIFGKVLIDIELILNYNNNANFSVKMIISLILALVEDLDLTTDFLC